MTERPILFSGPMVRAILGGAKTQTRRPVERLGCDDEYIFEPGGGRQWRVYLPVHGEVCESEVTLVQQHCLIKCPYGAPGDRLWVRESHVIVPAMRKGDTRWSVWSGLPFQLDPNDEQAAYFREGFDRAGVRRWRPPMHMFRWASRIDLEVTSVRVERMHDISDADARAEGFRSRAEFLAAWREIYGDGNPWVWAIGFERVRP